MRYWIYWIDLVQGPFTPEELSVLSAFSEDLQVCPENSQEWLPASRVADLYPVVELWRSRRQAPVPAPAPPPPPRSPVNRPLQGEFFSEAPGQQTLFNPADNGRDGPKGPFAFYPVEAGDRMTVDGAPAVTMPIRFMGNAAVAVRSAPLPVWTLPPVVTVEQGDAVNEDNTFVQEEAWADFPTSSPDSAQVPAARSFQFEPLPPPPEFEMPVPVEMPKPVDAPPTADELPRVIPPFFPSLDSPTERPRKPSTGLAPWVAGAFALLMCTALGLYWWMDHATSVSAIKEAVHHPAVPKGIIPIPPLAAPPTPPAKKTISLPTVIRRGIPAIRKKTVTIAKKTASLVVPPPPVKAVVSMPEKSLPVPAHPVSAPVMAPVAKAVPAPSAAGVATPDLPGLKPVIETVPGASSLQPVRPVSERKDPWGSRQLEAIDVVMKRKIVGGKQTVGGQAKAMLDTMHEKELMHAAETGERLYLPDKSAWSALRQDGPVYRVYLNFSALQANGERNQTRSYQFIVDLQKKSVTTDDTAARQDFLDASTIAAPKHPPMAAEIDTLLGGVDTLNKHKLRSMMAGKSRRISKQVKKNLETTVKAAQQKVERAVIYFRTRYPEQSLQNVAKAYGFTAVVNGGK